MSVHGNRKESVDAFLDGRNHEKYHYFCCSSGSSGNIYSFVQLGGFSDKFGTELSALDFCLRVREHGYRIVNAAHAKWQLHDLPDSVRQVREAAIVDAQMERTERDLFEILWSQVLSLR